MCNCIKAIPKTSVKNDFSKHNGCLEMSTEVKSYVSVVNDESYKEGDVVASRLNNCAIYWQHLIIR